MTLEPACDLAQQIRDYLARYNRIIPDALGIQEMPMTLNQTPKRTRTTRLDP